MDSKLHISSSPHFHSKMSTRGIMIDVAISLLPATIVGVYVFGLRALLVVAVCLLASVGSEAIFNLITKKEQTIGDFSAVVTGLILALNLPANTPLWQAAIGSIFAIIVVKCLFGGVGCNIVNPAATARVFMIVAFASLAKPAFPKGVDAVSSATPLVELSKGQTPELMELFLGNVGGAIGETCKLALLIGGIYLICRKIITWHMPVFYIGTVFLFTFFVVGFDLEVALAYTLSGGLFLGAFYMLTDYVTSPATPWGKVIFGIGAGIITVMIRMWGNYPEGVSFAILLMNILDPYIDAWTTRRLFGGNKK